MGNSWADAAKLFVMSRSCSDADAIRASIEEPEAFGALFDTHFKTVARFVERRLGPGPACEVATDVFVVAFSRRDTFDTTRASALPWLLGIASNRVLAERRRFGRYLSALERLGRERAVTDVFDPAGLVESAEFAGRVRQALLALEDSERELLLLVAWEGFSYEDAAEAFGLPIGTVRSRVHRTRARLRDLLGLDRAEVYP